MTFRATVLIVGWLATCAPASAQAPPAPPATPKSPPDTTAPGIPGVVAAGTKVQLIRDLFQSTEGPIAMPDGSFLFTEQDAGDGRLTRIDNDGNISTYLENTNRTIGLAYDAKGRLIGTQSREPRVGVLAPARSVLADQFGGQPLVFPNDLVADKKGGVYFTDQLNARFRPPPPGRKAALFYIRPDGQLVKLTEEIENPAASVDIEVSRRLVGEHDLGLVDQRARDRNTLTLAARKFGGAVSESVREPAGRKKVGGALTQRRTLRHPTQPRKTDQRRKHRVLQHGELGQQVVELKDEAHIAVAVAVFAAGIEVAQILATKENRPRVGIGAIKPAQKMQQRALARA